MTQPLRVLIGCATSCVALDAFLALGHDAWQCDLLPADKPTNRHIQDDIRNVLHMGWDLALVSNPPCTRLCNSGVRWLSQPPTGKTVAQMWAELDDGADALFGAVDLQDVLERERLEVQAVGGVVVGRDRLGVGVHHHRLVARGAEIGRASCRERVSSPV